MYEQYWGFDRAPFKNPAETSGYYVGSPQDEALARIDFVVENSYRVALLAGSCGTGKSLLMERVSRTLQSAGHVTAHINLLGIDGENFAFELANALPVHYQDRDNYATTWRGILDVFHVTRCQNLKTILFFDDADTAEDDVLTNIVRLSQWKAGEETQVSLVLSVQAGNVANLGERLLQLANLRVDLFPWELGDVAGFIEQSLAQVGRNERVFSDEAYAAILDLSGGVARQVRKLAELSLVAAAGQELGMIESDTIEMVDSAFGIHAAATH
jgi:general secretion pathway protein A